MLGSTYSSACDISDCLPQSTEKNETARESGDCIRLGQLGSKDLYVVFPEKLFCDDSGKSVSAERYRRGAVLFTEEMVSEKTEK